MKKIMILFITIFILLLSGCENPISSLNNSNSSDIDSEDSSVQSNLMLGGTLVENQDVLIFNNYVYDKASGEVIMLCKDAECSHEAGVSYTQDICIMQKGINSLQIYNDDILCTVSSASNDIYKLDCESGELSVFYNGDISINSFRLCGNDKVIINSNTGLYSADLNSGEKIKLIKGIISDENYTNDDNYLYISMEDFSLHRISLDGTEDIVLTIHGRFPIVHDNRVYYSYTVDDDWCLKSMNINGSDEAVVVADMMTYTIYSDKIYYSTASYPRKVMMCDIDGTNHKEIMDGTADFYILPESQKVILSIFNGYFSDKTYMIMNLDGSKLKDFPVYNLE